MSNHNEQSAINPAGDGSDPRSNSGISTPPPPDTQQDTKRDLGSEWIQSAMALAKELHKNDALRREVAKRLF